MLIKLFSFVFIFYFISSAQIDSTRIEMDEVLADLIDESDEEIDYSDLYEEVENYIEHPLNLNTATLEDLASLPNFDISIAQKIVVHRDKYGPFFSVNELYSIPDIPETLLRKNLIFLEVMNQETKENNIEEDIPSLTLRNRIIYDIQPVKGFQENIFRGSPCKSFSRLKVNFNDDVTGSILIDKDAGESSYFDFVSGYLNISNWMDISNLIIGDFALRFGQGLSLSNSYSMSKGSNAISPVFKNSKSLNPYSSSTENNFFRGAAIEKEWEHFQLMGFFSMNRQDANIDSVSGKIISLPRDGLHRTVNEIIKRKSAIETNYGVTVKTNPFKIIEFGLLYYKTKFNHQFYSPNSFNINGDKLNNYSTYFNLYDNNYNILGEILYNGKSAASFVRLNFQSSSRFVYTVSIRNYPNNFISLHGKGFGEKSGTNNDEFGIYNGIRWSMILGDINFYYDQFKFPHTTSNNPIPSEGNEIMCSLNINSLKNFIFKIKYKFENKEILQDVDNSELVKRLKQSFSSEIIYNLSTYIRLISKFEYLKLFIHDTNVLEEGYLIYQDIRIKPTNNLMIYSRLAVFATDSFNSALFNYENNLAGIINSIGLYGQGTRIYIILKYDFIKQASFSIKYSETYKPKMSSIGSGNSEIDGNLDNSVGIQLDFNF